MEITLKKIAMAVILLAIIMIILASISFADNQTRKKEIKRDQDFIARQTEIWETSKIMFRYNAMKLRVRNLEEEIDKITAEHAKMKIDYTIQLAINVKALEEIDKMGFFLGLVKAIAEANNMVIPEYIEEDLTPESLKSESEETDE